MSFSGQAYNFDKTIDLQPLARLRSDQGPVFSLYLDRGIPNQENLLARFQKLIQQPPVQKKLGKETAASRELWEKEAERINQWLEKPPSQGKGLAIFSSIPAGLWQVYILPVPVFERLVFSSRPYLRPLEILIGEFKSQRAEVNSEQEGLLEVQRVEKLLELVRSGGAAVTGADQTLLAVKEKRTRLLVVDGNFHPSGGECPNCGYLGAGEQEVCPLCGVALHPEPDIVEVALKRVLDQGSEIEILRSTQSRGIFEPFSQIGAFLKDTGKPPEKDSSNQQVISRDGVINRDVLHDETIEESFPASDPPGWNH